MLRLVLASGSLAVALSGAVGGAEDCRACDDTGTVPCRKCARDACSPSETLLFCSIALGCEACDGLGGVPCKRCGRPPAADPAERRAANRAWLERVREVDAFMEAELAHAESEHFVLTFDLPRVDAKGGGSKHGAMHLYLARLEELYARFVADVGANPAEDFFGKTHVMLWRDASSQERASLRYTRQPSTTQSKLMGADPVVSIHYDKSHLHEEFELHQAVVHQVAHCLLSNVFDGIWPGNIGGGWIDAGLAHHYEVSMFGGVRHYCYVESDTMGYFQFGTWEPSVRKAVDAGEALPLLQVAGKHTTELTPEQHMFAWSYVDFVLRARPGRFGALAKAVKGKLSLKDTLERALGVTPFELQSEWEQFVREHYSTRPKRR